MSAVKVEVNPDSNNQSTSEPGPVGRNHLHDLSETCNSRLLPSADEEEIMKLLSMDGFPGDITMTARVSSINSQNMNGNCGQSSYSNHGNSTNDVYYRREVKRDMNAMPEFTQEEKNTNSKNLFGGGKKENPRISQPIAALQELAQRKQETISLQQLAWSENTRPHSEPKNGAGGDSQSLQDGEHKIIKVLMKSAQKQDPLGTLQVRLQKMQENMASHQQYNLLHQRLQHQPSPGRPSQGQGQTVNTNQGQIKQEPGVHNIQNNQYTEQQFIQQQQQQQIRFQQIQQQQRMQQWQQPPQQFRPGISHMRPPPPLQNSSAQMQTVFQHVQETTSVFQGPVQCEKCHQRFHTKRGYLIHRHTCIHRACRDGPQTSPLFTTLTTNCKTCLARAKFSMACARGKTYPGKVDLTSPCIECGSKSIPNMPPSDAIAMQQVYNQGMHQQRPFFAPSMPSTVRTLHCQWLQQYQHGSLEQSMAQQAQRLAIRYLGYRTQGPYQSDETKRIHDKIKADEDIKTVCVTPGRPSQKSPSKSPHMKRQPVQGQNGLESHAKRKQVEEHSQNTMAKSSKSNNPPSSTADVSPEVTSSTVSQKYNKNTDTDGMLDLLVQQKKIYECTHCKILFREFSLYAVHIGMHSSEDPMQCSMCGKGCSSKFEFLCHHNKNNESDK